MQTLADDLVKDALELGAAHAAIADASCIQFHEEYRKLCERNACGKYATNWMGPPAIGPIADLAPIVRKYKQGLLFQTVHQISSSSDWNGMMEGARKHELVFRELLVNVRGKHHLSDLLPLNAGCCSLCPRCAYLDNEPCRNPDRAVASVEAYGIDVMSLVAGAGIPYYNGKNTVSYVGLILFG
jgi:predicted metal-binding protein